MNIKLDRYSMVDGQFIPDESGEWCMADHAISIMSEAAASVYSQISVAVEYANAAKASSNSTKIYIDAIKSYLETVWGQGNE